MSEKVDVLSVMDLHLAAMRQGRVPAEAKKYYDDAQAKFSAARGAIAELLEADVEFDAADLAADYRKVATMRRFHAAQERRAAAIAACTPGEQT